MKRILSATLCLLMALCLALPLTAFARTPEQKVVRVGWYESTYCYRDSFGKRRGIAYEYQQKLAAHTGWTYEYVEDSWPNLLQMLMDGKLDLLSDVSYNEERAQHMLYPSLAMGAESYYLYIDADNTEIDSEDLLTLNGKTVGVNKGSYQVGLLRDWQAKNGISLEILELTDDEADSMSMLSRGDIDAFVSMNSMGAKERVIPVCKIGASDYYFAVNKDRPDLLNELNAALAAIQDEDPYFNQRMFDEYIQLTKTNAFLSSAQESWLAEHGTIRVGYRDDYLPFCAQDPANGELTGALKNYLAHAENCLKNAQIHFETVPYPTTDAALAAMRSGEVDCVFPVDLSSDYCEANDLLTVNPIMQTEMTVVMRAADRSELAAGRALTVAVNEGNVSFETFLMDHMPEWKTLICANVEDCFRAVATKAADCVLVCDYRLNDVEPMRARYKLVALPTGDSMELSFAVRRDQHALYSILNKISNLSSNVDMEYALVSYMYSNQKVSFLDFLQDNWIGVLAVLAAVFAVILFLLRQKLKGERRLNEQERQIEEALRRELQQKEQLESVTRIAYTDPLTGVKSKVAFKEAGQRMDQRIAQGAVSEFGVVVFDLNDLKQINDNFGHKVGDEYIRDACKLICTSFKHSPVFRVGGDEFIAVLEGADYANREMLLERFRRQALENQDRDHAVVACGCACFDPGQDTSIRTVTERADAAMYREKNRIKNLGAAVGERPEPPAGSAAAQEEDDPVLHARKCILIADDIESNREMLGDLLKEDYDIDYAADGTQTLEILRERRDEIALLILDLYMPNMSGREVLAQMQVDGELMSIPVIVLTVDQEAELECLRMGAMDFIPKPYPDIEIVKARIAKCIELSENRELIRRTRLDTATGLLNIYYFTRYVSRYDRYNKGASFDAIACDVNRFTELKQQYGQQFSDHLLRSIGAGIHKLVRKTGGIGCRKERDTFFIYCPHQDDYEPLLKELLEELAAEQELAGRAELRFGVYADAQQEPDIEERFVRAKIAADSVENDPQRLCGFYEFQSN